MYRFVGFVKEDYKHEHESLPRNAKLIPDDDSKLKKIIVGLIGIAIGYGLLLFKQYKFNDGNKEILSSSEYLQMCGRAGRRGIDTIGNVIIVFFEQSVDKDTLKILKDAVATDALIIWVIDLFSFNGTLNPDIVKKVKKLDVVIFGTKKDLFDNNSDATLSRFIDERFSEYGINPVWIKLLGKDDNESSAILKKLNELRKNYKS